MGRPTRWEPTEFDKDKAVTSAQIFYTNKSKVNAVLASIAPSVDAAIQAAYDAGVTEAYDRAMASKEGHRG